MTVDKALTWFINVWSGLFLIINGLIVVGLMVVAPTFWSGIARLWDYADPFDVSNLLFESILVSPALYAIYWQYKRRQQS